jgi:predicted RNA-binding Zn-ribbon protein involved in translation (DUF1610 family)
LRYRAVRGMRMASEGRCARCLTDVPSMARVARFLTPSCGPTRVWSRAESVRRACVAGSPAYPPQAGPPFRARHARFVTFQWAFSLEKLASAAGWRGHAEAGVLVSSFWDPTPDVLLTLPARRNQNLRSTYHLCGELACTPSGGSGGHGH